VIELYLTILLTAPIAEGKGNAQKARARKKKGNYSNQHAVKTTIGMLELETYLESPAAFSGWSIGRNNKEKCKEVI
jgi:hypothetical protein